MVRTGYSSFALNRGDTVKRNTVERICTCGEASESSGIVYVLFVGGSGMLKIKAIKGNVMH